MDQRTNIPMDQWSIGPMNPPSSIYLKLSVNTVKTVNKLNKVNISEPSASSSWLCEHFFTNNLSFINQLWFWSNWLNVIVVDWLSLQLVDNYCLGLVSLLETGEMMRLLLWSTSAPSTIFAEATFVFGQNKILILLLSLRESKPNTDQNTFVLGQNKILKLLLSLLLLNSLA